MKNIDVYEYDRVLNFARTLRRMNLIDSYSFYQRTRMKLFRRTKAYQSLVSK